VTALVAEVAGGARLSVEVLGEGPPLLLIPGLGTTRVAFQPLLPLLRERHRVITYDPRGTGESEAGDAPQTMRLLATYRPGGPEKVLEDLPDFKEVPAGEAPAWVRR